MTAASAPNRSVGVQQRAASDPAISAWVSASAGTGKTRVLTDRVLRLLIGNTRPGQILCLTFTNAAAAEMANRVNGRLSEWATTNEAELERDLRELIGSRPTLEQRLLARRLFARVLDAPEGVRIQTIHSFCQSLLARFPLEAGLPPQFTVMDERTANELLREARDDMLARIRANGDATLAPVLDEISQHLREDAFLRLMNAFVLDRGRVRNMLEAHGGLDATIDAVREALALAPGESIEAAIADACRDHAFDMLGLRRSIKALNQGTPSDLKKAAIMAAWHAAPETRASTFNAYLEAFFKDHGRGGVFAKLCTLDTERDYPGTTEVLAREAERLDRVRERVKAIQLLRATAAALTIADALLESYEAAKRRRARLDYDDLIAHARRLLERPGIAPWVLYKLDKGIDHVLIDEAQDTNPDQWAIIGALTDEFFVGAGARPDVDRTVFAVGDPKQSIFSFLRADPAAFAHWRHVFESRAAGAKKQFRTVPLDTSFRSGAAVLDAVNAVFAQPEARRGVSEEESIAHRLARIGQGGAVEIWPVEAPADKADLDLWDPPVAPQQYRSPRVALAARIAVQIRSWIDAGERLSSRDRPVAEGDILILVQSRSAFVPEVVRALKSRNVAVAGSDRMVLTEQLAVRDLIALGRFVLLPDDDLTLATVLKSPLVGWDDEILFALAHGRSRSLWRTLIERATERLEFGHARKLLAERLERADFTPPYEFFAEALAARDGRRELVRRLGPQANDPIDEFLALALHYERAHVPSLEGFLHWIESDDLQIRRDHEHGRNEVRVMTVHGAKGLEAPIVFMADATRMPREQTQLLSWIERDGQPLVLWPPKREFEEAVAARARAEATRRQAEEYRRLLYVAMTRAEDRLIVCGWRDAQQLSPDCWYNLVSRGLAGTLAEVTVWPGATVLRRAIPQTAPPDHGEPSSGAVASTPLPRWLGAKPAAEPVPPRPLAPSQPSGVEPAVRSPLSAAAPSPYVRGRLIHALLERLPDVPTHDRRAAARRVLDVHRDIDEAARAEIADATLAILEDRRFAALFGPGSRAEVPVAGVVGGQAIAGQIDRVAVSEDAVAIVDFKSNRPAPREEANVPIAYLRQMAAYRALMKKIFPAKSVVCYLLWSDGPSLMPLRDATLEEIASRNFA